jgi:hypothetical protein
VVENRQDECSSLSTSRHRAGEHVAPLEGRWYRLSLNWSWSLESQLLETFMEAGVKL